MISFFRRLIRIHGSRAHHVAAGAVVLGATLAAPHIALAHATLVRAEPALNARLSACPVRVRLEFNEAIEPTMANASILDVRGRQVTLSFSGDPHDVHAVIAPISCLSEGAYRLTWRVVSADGHPVGGAYGFTIGNAGSAALAAMSAHDSAMLEHEPEMMAPERAVWGIAAAGAPLAVAVLRGVAVGALLALSGLLFFRSGAQRAQVRSVDVLVRWLSFLAPLLLAAHFLAWSMNADSMHRLTAESVGVAANTGTGKRELLRIGLTLLALWALALAKRAKLALTFGAAALIVSSSIGHTAAIGPAWSVPGKALHLLSAAAWIGGVLWLVLLDRMDVSTLARETRRVSRTAMVCVIAVVISGLLQSFLFLSSPSDLLHSPYGGLVVAKIVGTLVLIGFGAHHRTRTMPRGDEVWSPGRFVATLRGELLVMMMVVLLGGLLAYVPMPHVMPEMNNPATEP